MPLENDLWPYPLDVVSVRTVAFGLAALGAVAGFLGTFAVVRKQALQGDAISHIALSGIAIAFLSGARDPLMILLGAGVAGWVAMTLVAEIVRRSRVPFDSALAGALAVFFGFGLVLMTYLKKLAGRTPDNAIERWIHHHAEDATRHGLEQYLFGEAAFLLKEQVWQIVFIGGVAVVVAILFWKEFKLISFDRDFAASLGYPTRAPEWLLTTLIVIAVVIGLRAVGVVLMSALLVAPAVAARQWTNRLGGVATGAAVLGALAGFFGEIASHLLSESVKRSVPTGPVVVLCATSLVVVSLLIAPKGGLLWKLWRKRAQA